VTLLEEAIRWHNAGIVALPVRTDGTKAPGLTSWKEYQQRKPTIEELVEWFTGDTDGIGVLTGSISGHLEMVELEGRAVDAAALDKLEQYAHDNGAIDLFNRLIDGYCERSPSGGIHILYRIEGGGVRKNTKLARTPQRDVLAETRGEGGFVVVAPSAGRTHPTGDPWTLISGSIEDIPTVTIDQRDHLWALVRMLDEEPEREPVAAHSAGGMLGTTVGLRPGDDYNERADWADILTGWTRATRMGNGYGWRKPAKEGPGISATTGQSSDGIDRLYVFSTSTEFEPERPYNKFSAYTTLKHSGDYSAAASALSADGYGTQRTPTTITLDTINEPDTDDPLATTPYDRAVQERFVQLRILEDAKQLLNAHKAGTAHPLQAINLTEFLTQPDETEQYRITGLWPAQGRVLLAAAAKAGKTTIVVGNLLPSLVDGRAFLGEHSTQPVSGRVTYLNMEVGERIIRTWMRRAGIVNTDQINVVNLRGKASALTLATDQGRQRFAAFLRNQQTETVILDPLAPLLATLSLDENSNTDIALFFSWWAEMLNHAEVTDDLIVHHTGHAGQRSRGASRLLDEPDAIWTLTKGLGTDPDDDETLGSTQPRFLTAYGRDVDKAEEGLDYNPDTGLLTYNGQNRSQSKTAGKVNHITDILQDQTPRSTNQICQAVGGDRNKAYAAVKKMVDNGTLFQVGKTSNGHPLYVLDTTK
jgi:AAA domain/Bifunctional DNA primase/polymerase, N-terminal